MDDSHRVFDSYGRLLHVDYASHDDSIISNTVKLFSRSGIPPSVSLRTGRRSAYSVFVTMLLMYADMRQYAPVKSCVRYKGLACVTKFTIAKKIWARYKGLRSYN